MKLGQYLFICSLAIISLTSCRDTNIHTFVCNCEESSKVQQFVSDNMKNSNNMSDEEMEDVIKELLITGVRLNCKQRFLWYDWTGKLLPERNNLDSCDVVYPYYKY